MMFGLTTLGQAPFGTAGGESITGETVSLPVSVTVSHAVSDYAGARDIRVQLGGADVSDRITGEVVIEAEESMSRVASLKLVSQGDTLAGLAGASLRIEVKPTAASAWVRRFTGTVAVPDFDPDNGLITLHATDGRRDMLAGSSRADIDALIGGYWSRAVFPRYADSLQYANDRLSTVAAALDLDVYGNPRLTPWAGLSPSLVVTDAQVLDGSLTIHPVARQSVINCITNDNKSVQDIRTTSICQLSDGKAVTMATMPTISGTAVPGMTITVELAGQKLAAVAGAGGTWSVKVAKPLADGRYTPKVTLTSGAVSCVMWGTPFRVARDGKGSAITGESAQEVVTDCSFQYRYPRLHEYRRTYTWSMGMSYAEYAKGNNGKPYKLPEKSLFKSAVESSGWKLLSEFYTPPLQGQHYVGYIDSSGNLHDGETVPSDAAAVLWYRNDYTGKVEDDPRCESAVIAIAKRVVQALTERWRITVTAPDSITALGNLKQQGQTASLDATGGFDASSWVDSTTMLPDVKNTSADLVDLAGASRADSTLALQTLAAIARRKILLSHRATRVKFGLPANPVVDLDRAIRIDSAVLGATGKVYRLTEHYDLSA
ncbi:Ig-like domain-containing protein [Paludibacterium denitrificans]|uniref:Bacterial Ig-like domain-containing protein n=1 Tax=Paludibacterium denitrificans TaxID=2675226 RepID=A0A844GHG6_9NEIS|nr:Ig-like domain-containing protein [Paludibacterium denitrificans]MTD34104.1 hypothetical protein [Paludibacterium denitrificans]